MQIEELIERNRRQRSRMQRLVELDRSGAKRMSRSDARRLVREIEAMDRDIASAKAQLQSEKEREQAENMSAFWERAKQKRERN